MKAARAKPFTRSQIAGHIARKIAELEADERYKSYVKSGPAQVHINAPLALIQVAIKNQLGMLRWVQEMLEQK